MTAKSNKVSTADIRVLGEPQNAIDDKKSADGILYANNRKGEWRVFPVSHGGMRAVLGVDGEEATKKFYFIAKDWDEVVRQWVGDLNRARAGGLDKRHYL